VKHSDSVSIKQTNNFELGLRQFIKGIAWCHRPWKPLWCEALVPWPRDSYFTCILCS